MIIDAGRGQVQLPRHVHTTTTSPRRQTTSYSAPMMMVIGNVKVEGTVTPALFDTGAEVSLITESALRRLAPDAIVTSSITRHIAVADGGALQVNGTTRLTVSTDKIAIDDEFIVITDDLSVPVLLGCPTLGKLKTTIQINPEGMHVITNDEHDFSPYEPEKMVRFAQPGEGELSDDRDREYILTSYKINHVHQLFLRQDKYTTTLPNGMLEDIIYSDANIFPQDSFLGRADCNHSGKDPTTKYYVHYAATPPTTTTTKDSMTPHKIDDIMEKEEEDADVHSDDNLPPWEVLIRQWIQDDSTPLGRACVRVPWLNDERPPFNFKNAAERGAASVRRLTPDQRQSFEAALQAYVERGFCVIVKDNNVGGRHSIPTFNECQDAWDAMTRGTALEGTVVIKPYRFTPSHMVFRDHHPTTPCRIVLDFRKLNQFAARGGKSQNDLQGVLLQLRSFRYFISADVSKAFCQMKASLYDVGYSSYTCIGNYTVLWSSIAFGSNNAPCMLEASTHDVVTEIHGLVQTAKDNMTGPREDLTTEEPPRLSYMQVERALLRPSATGVEYILRGPKIPLRMFLLKYVDDLFFGARTKEGVCESYDFGSYVFGGHGFKSDPVKNFCNWLVSEDDHDLKKSVLGYVLRLSQDKFHAVYSGHVPEGRVTKLQACAALASLYDQLGLYVELDLQGRLLWREICNNHKSWDDVLSDDLVRRIRGWVTLCSNVTTTVGFERYIDSENHPLLVSSDASGECWGVDVRCINDENTTTRVMARGGVFPLTQSKWSIPRKELVALYRALLWIRSTSAYLPVKTHLRPHQSPLEPLVPQLPARQVTLLCDSEVTVYRLRRPSRDKKLPIVERRRLKEIRQMCQQLDVIIKHIPSELNYADAISRAKFNGTGLDGAAVYKAMSVSEVVYDYREVSDEELEDDFGDKNDIRPSTSATNIPVANTTNQLDQPDEKATTNSDSVTNVPVANATNQQTQREETATTNSEEVTNVPVANATTNLKATVMMLNDDGIDLPNYENLSVEEQDDLRLLERYARPVEDVDQELQQDGRYERCLTACLRRAQELDEDLTDFKNLLLERVTLKVLGAKNGKLRRLARICYVDEDGLVRRHPSPERLRKVEEDVNGVIYLGNNFYTSALIKVLAVIYHYKHLHLGARRVCNLLQRRLYCKKMTRLVQSTLKTCTSCIKARATRQFNYVTNHVQDLLTTGLWQVVGVDVAGPYGKAPRATPGQGEAHYVLLVQDYVSGFTAARPLRDSKSKSVADGLHGIFCEHGSPSVVLSDHDTTSLITRNVRRVLQRHGTKHYVLPGYGQYLSFWERSHKDMVDVVKAVRESRHTTERSNVDDTFINDYLLSVRAYNTTPRGWANASPAELHYVYKGRLPGDQEGLSELVDWESLRLKHTDVDIIKTLREAIPVADAVKQRTSSTLNDYVDYWRLKQERLLERYAREREGSYIPKIYDVVFTTKAGDVQLGGHLEASWSGPSTVTKLRGSAVVEVTPGIILPGTGGVNSNDDMTEVHVPVGYGEPQTYPLKNVYYASGLHDVIYKYYTKGTRVFVDSDGTIKSMGIDLNNDLELMRRQRYDTAMSKAVWPPAQPDDHEDGQLDDIIHQRGNEEDVITDVIEDGIHQQGCQETVIPDVMDDDIQSNDPIISGRGAMIPQDASVVDEGRNSGRLIEKSTRRGDPKGGDGLTTTPSRNVSEPHVEDTVDFAADEETDGDRQRFSPGVPDEEENDDDNGEPPETFMTPSSRATDEEERLATTTGSVPTTSRATTRSRRSSTSTRSFTTRLEELRESLGTSTRHTYGKFVNTAPMNGSLVVLVDADYTGLARVINHDDQGRAVLQPMDVIQEGVLTRAEDNETKGQLHVNIDNIIYVRPSNRSLTRARGKDLRELLAYIDDYMQ